MSSYTLAAPCRCPTSSPCTRCGGRLVRRARARSSQSPAPAMHDVRMATASQSARESDETFREHADRTRRAHHAIQITKAQERSAQMAPAWVAEEWHKLGSSQPTQVPVRDRYTASDSAFEHYVARFIVW